MKTLTYFKGKKFKKYLTYVRRVWIGRTDRKRYECGRIILHNCVLLYICRVFFVEMYGVFLKGLITMIKKYVWIKMKVIARKYVQHSIVYFRAINLNAKCWWYMLLASKEIIFFLCLSALINVNGFQIFCMYKNVNKYF